MAEAARATIDVTSAPDNQNRSECTAKGKKKTEPTYGDEQLIADVSGRGSVPFSGPPMRKAPAQRPNPLPLQRRNPLTTAPQIRMIGRIAREFLLEESYCNSLWKASNNHTKDSEKQVIFASVFLR